MKGMSKKPHLQRAHDVRLLRVCIRCGGVGVGKAVDATRLNLPVIVSTDEGDTHPACVPAAALLTIPPAQLGEVRICDVPATTMELVLARYAAR